MTWRKWMSKENTAITNDGAIVGTNASCSRKTAKSFISDERRVQDALGDDEVREVLRSFHHVREAAK
jgi:hypothetical protein